MSVTLSALSPARLARLLQRHLAKGGDRPFRVERAIVEGDIDLRKRSLPFDIELVACHVKGAVLLEGFTGRSIELSGLIASAMRAEGARLAGSLILTASRLGHPRGVCCPLEDIDSSGDEIAARHRLSQDRSNAVVTLTGARIDGDLVLTKAVLSSVHQWSLLASQLRVEGSVRAEHFYAHGALYLRAAQVGGSVLLEGAEVGGLDATAAEVRVSFHADWGFRSKGQVRLRSASVGDVVTFHDACVHSLSLARLKAERLRLSLHEAPPGRIVLRDTHVDSIVDASDKWPAKGNLDVEGLTYRRLAGIERIDVRQRLAWLRLDPRVGSASFEQLASSYDHAGDDHSARRVRYIHQKDVYKQAGFFTRWWGLLQDVLFGYGYKPGRALLWLLVLVAAGTLWFHGRPPKPVAVGAPAWNAALYSLDLIIPFANLGQRNAWDPVGIDKTFSVALILAGWLLASAVLAGVTRILNRP